MMRTVVLVDTADGKKNIAKVEAEREDAIKLIEVLKNVYSGSTVVAMTSAEYKTLRGHISRVKMLVNRMNHYVKDGRKMIMTYVKGMLTEAGVVIAEIESGGTCGAKMDAEVARFKKNLSKIEKMVEEIEEGKGWYDV